MAAAIPRSPSRSHSPSLSVSLSSTLSLSLLLCPPHSLSLSLYSTLAQPEPHTPTTPHPPLPSPPLPNWFRNLLPVAHCQLEVSARETHRLACPGPVTLSLLPLKRSIQRLGAAEFMWAAVKITHNSPPARRPLFPWWFSKTEQKLKDMPPPLQFVEIYFCLCSFFLSLEFSFCPCVKRINFSSYTSFFLHNKIKTIAKKKSNKSSKQELKKAWKKTI